jgi:hypothetical protein
MPWHCQGVQTTQIKEMAILQAWANVDCLQPIEELCSTHNMFCFATFTNLHIRPMYTNSIGAFPIRSFCNMQYMFVAYIYDLNAILVRAMPSKTDGAMIAAFTADILANLNACGYSPVLIIMDNDCSKAIKAHIRSNHMDINLVPPLNHRVNATKCAIATFN